MIKAMQHVFGYQGISSKIESFYDLFKVGLVFTLFSLPWMLLNIFVKFGSSTFWLFGVGAIMVYPNFLAFFKSLQSKEKDEDTSIKKYLNTFQEAWKIMIGSRLPSLLIIVVSVTMYIFDLMLVMNVKQLKFMIIPILIMGMFGITSVAYYLFLSSDTKNLKQKSASIFRVAIFLGWKNIVFSSVIGLLITLWLSVGYQSPILNILIGNLLIPWSVYKLIKRSVRRLASK